MSLDGNTDQEKLNNLCKKPYKDQAIWFLNAQWKTLSNEAENIWKYVHKFEELDLQNHKEGNALDEMNAHRFLEHFSETRTVKELRDVLRAKGAIGNDRLKNFPITHYLAIRWDSDWHHLVHAPQGNQEEAEKAKALLDAVMKALHECEVKAKEAREAAIAAKKAENEAKDRELEAQRAESDARAREGVAKRAESEASEREAEAHATAESARAAAAELEAAVQELKAQEDAYKAKEADLIAKSEEGGVVSRNKAKNELAQHQAEDPLPLRKAKITQEAAFKKSDRARQLADAAHADALDARNTATEAANRATEARHSAEAAAAQATEARHLAEQASVHAQEAHAASEAQLEETRRKFEEAEAYMKKVQETVGHGALWWLERELHEAKLYMPQSKGGITKK